jgi:molybdopterin molybdotransferase
LIEFEHAISLLEQNQLAQKSELIDTVDASGRYLAEAIFSPIDLPPMTNSAVDGYALSTTHLLSLTDGMLIAQHLRAQGQKPAHLPSGATMKIMTGAPLPLGADAVVMQEHVHLEGDRVYLRAAPRAGENVRLQGEDILKGKPVAAANRLVTPELMGLCLGLGLKQILVHRKPRVCVISSGDELVWPGQELLHGQAYFLVGPMLKALAQESGFEVMETKLVEDSAQAIKHAIDNSTADVFFITGGMSKGDYDFSKAALEQCGVQEIFHCGRWRPGKPLYFGRRLQQFFFGLPGNPVAALVGFKIFIQSWHKKSLNIGYLTDLPTAILRDDFKKPAGFTFFARAQVGADGTAVILPGQGSHQLYTLSQANALCWLMPEPAVVKAGEKVRYLASLR